MNKSRAARLEVLEHTWAGKTVAFIVWGRTKCAR